MRKKQQQQLHQFIVSAIITIGLLASGVSLSAKKKVERTPGEVAFRAHCKTCHSLPRPKKWRDDEWPSLVARYGERANLDSTQIALITEYVVLVNDPAPSK